MGFPYKKVLVIGATSGIGRSLAGSLVGHGCFVIAVGRRQEHLDSLVETYGKDKVAILQFDISQLDKIPSFVKSITSVNPDLDCVILNSGIQRQSVFSNPADINMDVIQHEITVNYLSYLAFTKEFIPFFMAKRDIPTSFIYTSSSLALVPILRCSNYCASKAALHQWILCLRQQLKATNIKVIDIFPPAVQTELHDPKYQPDMARIPSNFGMPLELFTKETIEKLLAGSDQIPVGYAGVAFNGWEQARQKAFLDITEKIRVGGYF